MSPNSGSKLATRDIIIVSGIDAGGHLQTQLSQDVLALGEGDSAWSFMLSPKSEIVALIHVVRTGPAEYTLSTDLGTGDAVRGAMDQFLFRMDVSFEQETRLSKPVEIVGPGADVPIGADGEDLERIRVASGWPRLGSDIDGEMTPAMASIVEETVSFEKGCYTGQELVARVHHRGSTPPRRLVRLVFGKGESVPVGADVSVDDETVGVVTSAVGGTALAQVSRSVETPSTGSVGGVGVELVATRPS